MMDDSVVTTEAGNGNIETAEVRHTSATPSQIWFLT